MSITLHLAALIGDVIEMQNLLKQQEQLQLINSKDIYGFTPLLLATSSHNYQIVMRLLDNGADANICDNRGRSPLHYAAEIGRLDILLVLLDSGANIELTDNDHLTALHLASSDDIVKGLRDWKAMNVASSSNANPNVWKNRIVTWKYDSAGIDAFHKAVIEGNLENVQFFITIDMDLNMKNSDGDTALHLAAKGGFVKILRELLDCGAALDLQNNLRETALMAAASEGKEKCVAFLANRYDSFQNSAIEASRAIKLAAKNGHLKAVQILWDKCGYKSECECYELEQLDFIREWAVEFKYRKLLSTITSLDNFVINACKCTF